MTIYFTVIVPFSDSPTVWHPAFKDGNFSILSRGAFKTEALARDWAKLNLNGQPYSVKQFYGA